MRKLSFLFLTFFLALINLSAQNIVFTFNAKDASNTIDSIKATKVETGETAFVEGSNTINMSSFTTETKLFPTNSEEISVYPNPFENVTHLNFFSNQNDNIKVSLINASGQVVAEKKQNVTSGIHQFNISTNNNGLYILSIAGNQTKFSQKIISSKNNQSQNRIEYNGYSSMSPKEKSAKTETGELVFFFVYSGDNITKIADSPVESKTYEVEFYECKDGDGKSYPIVQIGEQWWIAKNLAYLPHVDSFSAYSDTVPYCYVYDYWGTNVSDAKTTNAYSTNGVLYNWKAATEYCPEGWHLPSDVEWNALAEDISNLKGPYRKDSGGWWDDVAKHLKTSSGWPEVDLNGDERITEEDACGGSDDIGFSAFPVGSYRLNFNGYEYVWGDGKSASFISATLKEEGKASYTYFHCENTMYFRRTALQRNGYSVRCIKD